MTFSIERVPDAAVAASICMTPTEWGALSEETKSSIRGLYALTTDLAGAHREIAMLKIHEKRSDFSLNLATLKHAVSVAQKAMRWVGGGS